MSVFRAHGPITKLGGVFYETAQQYMKLDLRPVSRIDFKFDPFHPASNAFRKLMHSFSTKKVRDTNYKCIYKTEVLCDNSEPLMICKLENGQTLRFEAGNLTNLELLTHFNRIVLPLCPPPEDLAAQAAIPKTKAQKRK